MMPRNYDRRRRDRGGRRGPPGRSAGGQGGRSRVANSQAVDNTPVPEGLIFYCKTCEQIVDYHPTSFNFKYPIDGCKKKAATMTVPAGTTAAAPSTAAAPGQLQAAPPEAASTAGSAKTAERPAGRVSDRRRAEPTCEIAYGTERSIKQYYKIKDDKFDAERRAREEKAARADKL